LDLSLFGSPPLLPVLLLLKARSVTVDQAGVRRTCRLVISRPRSRGVCRTRRAEKAALAAVLVVVAAAAAARLVEKDSDDDADEDSLGNHKRLPRARLRSKEPSMLLIGVILAQ
jgi:hypothetical protein